MEIDSPATVLVIPSYITAPPFPHEQLHSKYWVKCKIVIVYSASLTTGTQLGTSIQLTKFKK